MQNCDIRKSLDERWPNEYFHIVVTCWGIALDHRQYTHCGEHTQIIRACIESLQLPGLIKKVRIKLDGLWASGHATVRVVCICEGGTHKSVAFAAIMQDIYAQEGYNSKEPDHLSSCDALPSICWDCTECNANMQKATLMSFAQAEFISGQLL